MKKNLERINGMHNNWLNIQSKGKDILNMNQISKISLANAPFKNYTGILHYLEAVN